MKRAIVLGIIAAIAGLGAVTAVHGHGTQIAHYPLGRTRTGVE